MDITMNQAQYGLILFVVLSLIVFLYINQPWKS